MKELPKDQVASPKNSPEASKTQNWRKILELGKLAPTPHNTQWYFIHPVDQNTAYVGIDESIKLPFTDPDDQFRFAGLGVFVRHLELAAEATGFKLRTSLHDSGGRFPITVEITDQQAPDAALAELLRKRQTSRLAYSPQKISDDAFKSIQAMSDRSNSLQLSTDKGVVKAVLELNNKILLHDLEDTGVGKEVDTWIRYTKGSRLKHLDGFTPATLAVPAWKIWLVFRLKMLARLPFFRRWLTTQYLAQNQTATVGWIYGPLRSRAEQFQAGKFMMDVWLKLTKYGYCMQPYGSIITNHQARAELLKKIGVEERQGSMVWLAFRVGKSPKPARSPRKPVEEYLR